MGTENAGNGKERELEGHLYSFYFEEKLVYVNSLYYLRCTNSYRYTVTLPSPPHPSSFLQFNHQHRSFEGLSRRKKLLPYAPRIKV